MRVFAFDLEQEDIIKCCGKGRDAYPGTDLGARLWQVARLVQAGLPARVYAVRLAGFDTHARQAAAHPQLLKVLGDGELKKKLAVTAHRFSASAKTKIEAAGGSVTTLPGKKPVVKNKKSAAKK